MPVLTVTGRDVLFVHWPVDPESLAASVPDALAVETFDGSAWVSALALENRSVAPGSGRLSAGVTGGFPQLNLRTYVTVDGEPGVYFLSLDTGSRAAAAVGRRAFGLPFRHARMRLTRRNGTVTFRSRRSGTTDPSALFQARYRPRGEPSRAEDGSLAAFCIEHIRYYLPVAEDRRVGPRRPAGAGDGVYVGTIEREPWELRPVSATVRRTTLLEAAGLPAPSGEAVVHYSPGFEMGVEPVDWRPAPESASDARRERST